MKPNFALNITDAGQLLAWARSLQTLPMAGPAIAAWLQRMMARPAVQRVMADEGLPQPWV